MTPSQGGELAIFIFCAVIYVLYHWWVFFYDYQPQGTIKVMRAARNARRVWARSILADDKETVTGVQTLRNSIMAVTLFTVACGYVGARAIPELLLNNEWRQNLETLEQHDPITRAGGGVVLLHPAVKLGIALAVIFLSFMCFAQSGRLYSHVVCILRTITVSALGWARIRVGFMLRAVSSQGELCPEHLTFEVELLAVLDMAGFLFSLGLRIFVAFGLLVFWVVGPTTLLIVTVLAVIFLFAVDFVSVPKNRDLDTLQVGHA